ncbi:hypothetical protein GOODEAATRI_032578 [Goodea atripinnis]|uniref:Uncharacterized protein n=1 Tax=Goodea atripinnis TaxID=208336 RepID=A0ABV0PJC0_9TELE
MQGNIYSAFLTQGLWHVCKCHVIQLKRIRAKLFLNRDYEQGFPATTRNLQHCSSIPIIFRTNQGQIASSPSTYKRPCNMTLLQIKAQYQFA